MPYLALVLLACDGVLQMVVYQFDLEKLAAQKTVVLAELLSVILLVAVGYVLMVCLPTADVGEESGQDKPEAAEKQRKKRKAPRVMGEEKKREQLEILAGESGAGQDEAPSAAEQPAGAAKGKTSAAGQPAGAAKGKTPAAEQPAETAEAADSFPWDLILSEEYDLMQKIRKHSETLYKHSMRIGNLAQRAAVFSGADSKLAKAGGMYHEAGKLNDTKEYIEAGARIAAEYGFPEKLIDVIRQHSAGYEKPKSVEAAIVMLSDCIITTSDYLAENGKRERISDRRLVENIFLHRLEKGSLDESGITEEQLSRLKEFYIQFAFDIKG